MSFVLRTLRKEALLGITEVTEKNTHYWKMLPEFWNKIKEKFGEHRRQGRKRKLWLKSGDRNAINSG